MFTFFPGYFLVFPLALSFHMNSGGGAVVTWSAVKLEQSYRFIKCAWLIRCGGWGVLQIPRNQKLALRIVRYDISSHMEAVCEKVGCCDKSIRSHIGLENWQFCVVFLVTLQIGTFEHIATQNTMLQNPYFFCLFSSKRLYISQLCQQYIVIAYLCNNWVFL